MCLSIVTEMHARVFPHDHLIPLSLLRENAMTFNLWHLVERENWAQVICSLWWNAALTQVK